MYDLRGKNKERPKLIRFEEGGTIKDEILSMSKQKERTDARTTPCDACNIQHHTTLVLTSLLRLLMEAV